MDFTEIEILANNIINLDEDRLFAMIYANKGFQRAVIRLITEEQLFKKGVDETGEVIGYYSSFTENINPEKKAGTPYTLKDSGDFYSSLFITVDEDGFIIDGDAVKDDDNLFEKYGDGIIGLTDENQELVNELIKDLLLEIFQAEAFKTI